MRKALAILAITIVLSSLATLQPSVIASSTDNIVQNGGFETGSLTNWVSVEPNKWSVASTRSHSGDYSAFTQSDETGVPSALKYNFPSPLKVYQIASMSCCCFFESENATELTVEATFSDGTLNQNVIPNIRANDWVNLFNLIRITPDNYVKSMISIQFYSCANAKLWIDDVNVTIDESRSAPTPAPSTPLLRIKSDGTVGGTDKIQQNGNVYTFTDNIDAPKSGLLVEKDNVVIDGAGYTLKGKGVDVGIYVRGMQDVTVENLRIEGFTVGISTYHDANDPQFRRPLGRSTLNLHVTNNEISVTNSAVWPMADTQSGWGLYLEFAQNTVLSGNTIQTQDPVKGIYVGSCNNTSILDNNLAGCGLNLKTLNQKTIENNNINGKPIIFLKDTSNRTVDGAEQVFLYNCSGISVKNVNPNANYQATVQLEETALSNLTNCGGNIALTKSNNNTISDCTPHAIKLTHSSYNKIQSSKIIKSGQCIKLSDASNFNEICGNTITDSKNSPEAKDLFNAGQNTLGIQISSCQGTCIYANNITNHVLGLDCDEISASKIYGNTISQCNAAIILESSKDTCVYENNITDSPCSIYIRFGGSNNAFFHNNFLNNKGNVFEEHEVMSINGFTLPDVYSVNNTWDAGYNEGGNYWSDYNGTDENADGVGDAQYRISPDYIDHYPLMQPFKIPEYIKTVENQPALQGNNTVAPDMTETPTPTTQPTTTWITATTILATTVTVVALIIVAILIIYRKKIKPKDSL
jgi:putative cofactor-binding repeat protein